jgi:hypothetical protein
MQGNDAKWGILHCDRAICRLYGLVGYFRQVGASSDAKWPKTKATAPQYQECLSQSEDIPCCQAYS